MKFKDNILFLHFSDFVPEPISFSAYKKAKIRNNITVIGRGGNGREVLVEYESLPSKWKALICEKYDCPYTYAAAQIIKPHLEAPRKDADCIQGYITDLNQHLPEGYQKKYIEACAYLHLMSQAKTAKAIKALGFPNKGKFTETIQYLIKVDQVSLPSNYSNLRRKLKEYEEQGAQAVISNRFGNQNTAKISDEIEAWIIREMCHTRLTIESVHTRYLKVAKSLGFRDDISAEAFRHRVTQPQIRQIIELKRHGRKAVRSKHGHTFKLRPPVHSNDLWVGDGTAIDLAFRDDTRPSGMGMATVYMVMDCLSTAVLGHSMRQGLNKENFEMQLEAYRNAVRMSGCKPYQVLYDNQGGHKKAEAVRFYDALAEVHFPSKAYRSSAKFIEQTFGRFQREELAAYPFWTGFGRHTHSDLRNAPNNDDFKKHLDDLPTYDELTQLLQVIITDWNSGDHHSLNMSRSEAYAAHKDAQSATVGIEEMIEMFFLTTSEPIKYQAHGITMQRGGKSTTYEVYTNEGDVDFAFRERYMKAKFHLRYDPDGEYPEVQLLEPLQSGDMRLVAVAEPKRDVARVSKQLRKGEISRIRRTMEAEDAFYDKLEARAVECGYDEQAKWTDWRAKIGAPRINKPALPEAVPVSERSTGIDDWLDRM